eukprot:42616-Hanusia_phi.AAC.2
MYKQSWRSSANKLGEKSAVSLRRGRGRGRGSEEATRTERATARTTANGGATVAEARTSRVRLLRTVKLCMSAS